MNNKQKTVSGDIRNGSDENLKNHSGDFKAFSITNYATKSNELQETISNHLAQHKKVRKLIRCLACNKGKSPFKMSAYNAICKDCVHSLKAKGKTARNNFIERTKSNVDRFLQGVCFNV